MQEPVEVEVKPVRRRRFRISLRAFMVLILILACWLGYLIHMAREQARVVAAIKSYGGFVAYDWQYVGDRPTPGGRPWVPAWLRRTVGDDLLQRVVEVNLTYGIGPGGEMVPTTRMTDDVIDEVAKLGGLKYLYLRNGQATDRAMGVIGSITGLEVLMMSQAKITDAGFSKLVGLRNLKRLHVFDAGLGDESLRLVSRLSNLEHLAMQHNPFTDKGLYHLRGMTGLKSLTIDLGETDITDAGVAHLKGLTKLELLGLQRTRITDAALAELVGMGDLKQLWLGFSRGVTPGGAIERTTSVTPGAIAKLKAALPKLKIVR